MATTVKLPKWKAYLYTLAQRWRYYKWLNSSWVQLGLDNEEVKLLRSMFKKFIPKEVMRKPKAFRYDYLIKDVLIHNINLATVEEIELAQKLIWIKNLHMEDLIMEIKELKQFGKEVGLKPLAMGKMDEDELVQAILENIDTSKEYSEQFVEWYNGLDDDVIDAHEAEEMSNPETDTEGGEEDDLTDLSEIKEAVEEADSLDDLKEIVKDPDFKELFDGIDLRKKGKTKGALKKAMLACLEESDDDSNDEEEIDEETKEQMIELINDIESEEDATEFFEMEGVEEFFADKIEIEDEMSIDDLKAQLLNALGVESEEEEKPKDKPMTMKERLAAKKAAAKKEEKKESKDGDSVIEFDPDDFDPDAVYEEADGLNIGKLRKFVKELGITVKPGTKKDAIMEMVADKLAEMAEGGSGEDDDGEITITKSIVQDAIDAEDKDTLLEMADALDIKLNAMQKRSIKILGKKVLEEAPDDEPKSRKKETKSNKKKLKSEDKEAPKEETKSIYQVMEEMVLDGADESDIIKEVKPYYKERDKSDMFIKKRVKQMVTIITQDNE